MHSSLLAGSDFSGLNQVFHLRFTQLTHNLNIIIVNEDVLEITANFTSIGHISYKKGRIKITSSMATVNIADDDGKLAPVFPCAMIEYG